jgi:hypothetical protein
MSIYQGYNQQFLSRLQANQPLFNDVPATFEVGIRGIDRQNLPAGATHYWRVVGIHHLTPPENGGNHNIFFDVLDEIGNRVQGAKLVLAQATQAPLSAILDKGPQDAGDFVLFKTSNADIAVQWPPDNPLPSEAGAGFKIDRPGPGGGNSWGHHSFYIVFQKTLISQAGDGNGPSQPGGETSQPGGGTTQPTSLDQAISQAGQPHIIPLNPDAMFYKVGKQQNLGERLSAEYDVAHEGRIFRAQVFEKGIVYAEVGDWGNVKVIPRTN